MNSDKKMSEGVIQESTGGMESLINITPIRNKQPFRFDIGIHSNEATSRDRALKTHFDSLPFNNTDGFKMP